MRLLAVVVFLTPAAGCAAVLGLDSGDPLDAVPGDGGGTDGITVDANQSETAAGDSGLTCTATQKICGGDCREQDDPRYGCGPKACVACSGSNATEFTCNAGACKVTKCAPGVG